MNTDKHNTFRLSEDEWQRAKSCMREHLEFRASERRMSHYSELEQVILEQEQVTVEAWSVEMNWMLGEIADDCHDGHVPLLTALVTHRSGDLEPGMGFYEKSRDLGYSIPPQEGYIFWATMTQDCFKHWGFS